MANRKKYTNCDEVSKKLQKYFAGRSFKPGDRIPPERKIAEDLGFNRTTLRNAMQRMVEDGLLERQVGVGSFFKVNPKEMARDLAKINTKCSFLELLESRMMLEPEMAALAAHHITAQDIISLKNICKTKKGSIEKADIEFHDMLAELSENSMLIQMYKIISDLRKKLMTETYYDSYECSETWITQQNIIIVALEKRDHKKACTAVKEKLDCIMGEHSLLKKKGNL